MSSEMPSSPGAAVETVRMWGCGDVRGFVDMGAQYPHNF